MELSEKQTECLRWLLDKWSGISYILYGGAAGGGKTWIACAWLLGMCAQFPGVRYFIGRNNLKDSRNSIIVTFGKVAEWWNAFKDYSLNDNGIRFSNGSEIVLLDLSYYPIKDPDYIRLGSLEFTGGVVEEGGQVHRLAFDVLKSRIGRHYNTEYLIPAKILITCNPQKNWLYHFFYKPWRENRLAPPYLFIRSMASDNPFLSDEYRSKLDDIEDKVTRQRLRDGIWEYGTDDSQLCEYDAICDLFTNDYVREGLPAVLSADVALKGRDRYICGLLRGLVVRIVSDCPYMEAPNVENDIRMHMKTSRVSRSMVVVDTDGVGSYLGDYIKGINEFHGGGRALHPEKFGNIKSECAFKLAQFVNERKMHIICTSAQRDRIAEELEALRRANMENDIAKLMINTKDEMKMILGRSPDTLDMLIMGMTFHIRPVFGRGVASVPSLPS